MRGGLSLLEVVLAIVILAMSLVAVGQLTTIGAQQSLTVIEQSRGQQYAQSLLDSVAVGIVPMQSVGRSPIEFDDEWEYSLEIEDSSTEGLKSVTAIIQLANQAGQQAAPATSNQSAGSSLRGTSSSTVILQRLILDPAFVQDRVVNRSLIDEAILEEMIAAEEATTDEDEDDGGNLSAAPGGGR